MAPNSLYALMAISSPSLHSLSAISALFYREKRTRRTVQLNASRVPSDPKPKTKRENHLRKRLSNAKFSGALSANRLNQARLEAPVDEISNTNFLISHDADTLGFSKGESENEGSKQAALPMHVEESSNSQILVFQEVELNQISSEVDECSSTNDVVSKKVHQSEDLVGEEGIDTFGAPTFGLAFRIGAIFLAQTVFTVLFLGIGGILKERRENKKKREKIVKVEVKERAVMDEMEYENKVREIRAMADLVRKRESRRVEARERGSRMRRKGLGGDGSLNLNLNQLEGSSGEYINVSV